MNGIAQWMFAAVLAGMTLPALAGEPVKHQQQMRAPAPYLCAQVQLTGSAGGSYDTQQACNAAKPGLETSAKTDGNNQCDKLCMDMGCSATTVPDPLPAASSCRGRDPGNRKFYGMANTGPFDCKCTNP